MKTVTLITGATSGIGLACANLFAACGSTVIACDIVAPKSDIADRFAQQGVHFLELDVRDEEAVTRRIAAIADEFAGIDVLVNCAGVASYGSADMLSLAEWQRVLDINLTGSFLLCKHVMPIMLAQGKGAIVNVASIFGIEACDNNLAYNVSKGGVIQLTRSLAADYAQRGIRSNCVAPGLIETPMTAMVRDNTAVHDKFVSWHLQRRAGTPDEVANAIEFLASDRAAFVCGQVLAVDGGFTAGRQFAS